MYKDNKQIGLAPCLTCSPLGYLNSKRPDLDKIIRGIFSIDPVTGLPRNDLGTFMSENTDPQVKEFVSKILHKEFKPIVTKLDATDEDIAASTPDFDDTLISFKSRLDSFLENQKKELEETARTKRDKRIKDYLDKWSKSLHEN